MRHPAALGLIPVFGERETPKIVRLCVISSNRTCSALLSCCRIVDCVAIAQPRLFGGCAATLLTMFSKSPSRRLSRSQSARN